MITIIVLQFDHAVIAYILLRPPFRARDPGDYNGGLRSLSRVLLNTFMCHGCHNTAEGVFSGRYKTRNVEWNGTTEWNMEWNVKRKKP